MHDVIIDDTKTSMAVTTDKKYRTVKPAKKRRSFSTYLIDWVEKALIIACLLSIDFLLYIGAGSYDMFSSMTLFSLEVLYILSGIFVLSFVLMYIFSFSSFCQNLLTAGAVGLFVILMLNQFAAFDKNSMLASLASTYVSHDLGLLLNSVSHYVLAGVIAFIFFLFVSFASKKSIAYLVFLLIFVMIGITSVQFMGSNKHEKFKVVKDDVITPNATVGKKFVYIGMPTMGSYNYLHDALSKAQEGSVEYKALQDTLNIMLGFYAKNNFTLYPYAYVNDLDFANNVAQVLNNNNSKSLNEYLLDNIRVNGFWKFHNLNNKYVYLKENKLFDTFKKAKYGINAYQSGGIEMCYVNNDLVVDRCIEKNGLPIDFDGMNLTVIEKVEILVAQWLESWGLFENFAYSYNMLRPFVDVEKLPMVGVSYRNVDVKNSLDVLNMLEKDIAKDNGNKAYFVVLNAPSNTYIYDEFCNVKPFSEWQNKTDLPWVKKVSDKDKRLAYMNQLRCVYGRLERFIEYLNNSPSAQKTVVVIQGISGIDGMASLSGKNFIEELKNQKYVDMAIRDPLKKRFRTKNDICSAPNILKQYLYRKGPCPELEEFNLLPDAKESLRNSLKTLNFDENLINTSIQKFSEWYKKWLENRKLTPYQNVQETPIKDDVQDGVSESAAPETDKPNDEVAVPTDASVVKKAVDEISGDAVNTGEVEANIEENVVVGNAKIMENEIKDIPEQPVEKLVMPIEKTEGVPAAPDNIAPANEKLNIVIDNAVQVQNTESPLPVANDNLVQPLNQAQ